MPFAFYDHNESFSRSSGSALLPSCDTMLLVSSSFFQISQSIKRSSCKPASKHASKPDLLADASLLLQLDFSDLIPCLLSWYCFGHVHLILHGHLQPPFYFPIYIGWCQNETSKVLSPCIATVTLHFSHFQSKMQGCFMSKGRKKGQLLKEKTELPERSRNGPCYIMVQKPSFACEHGRMLPVALAQQPHIYPKQPWKQKC